MRTSKSSTLWDLHIHGVAGIDFMTCDSDSMKNACRILGNNGIKAFAPTLLTDSAENLLSACERWGQFLRSGPHLGALPIGLHLEGPFLSPSMAGAHPMGYLTPPSLGFAKALLSASCNTIAIVTLAPELKGSIRLIKFLDDKGIRVQMGHSHASQHEALTAINAGADGITHLFNAMSFHHREPGLLGAMIQSKKLTSELITDGLHVAPEVVLWITRSFPGRIYAVSDGCSATGAKRGCPLTLGALKIKRQGHVAVVANTGTLAGGATFLSEHSARLLRHLKRLGVATTAADLSGLFSPLPCPKLKKRFSINHS